MPLAPKVAKLFAPLKELGRLKSCVYIKITKSGDFNHLCDSAELSEKYFLSDEYKTEEGSFIPYEHRKAGFEIFTSENVKSEYRDIFQNKKAHLDLESFLIYTEKSKDYYEMLVLGSDLSNHAYSLNFYYQERPLIKKWFEFFKNEMKIEIKQNSKVPANLYHELGEKFKDAMPHAPIAVTFDQKLNFLREINTIPDDMLIPSLSAREIEVAKVLKTGASTSEVAQTLKISARTAESYIGNIKNKLNCNRKDELIKRLDICSILGLIG